MKNFSSFLTYLKNSKFLFCFIVFILLTIPLLFVSKGDISPEENRSLRKFPSLLSDNKINERFGIEFNDWFSDRFGGRQFLINSRFSVLYFLNNKIANKEVFMGDEGWIFPKKGIKRISSIEEQRNKIIKVANSIKKIDNYYDGKDIQIYIILEPSRSILYKKYWEKYYPFITHFDYYKQLKEELKEYSNIHYIELKDIFEENKDKIQLYEKNDPHMTLRAVNIMLEQVISKFDDNMPDKNLFEQYKKSIEYSDRDCRLFSNRLYDNMLKIKSVEEKDTCKEISIKNSRQKLVNQENGIKEVVVSNPYINKDLFMLTICYGDFMSPILGEFFSHTTVVNYNVIKEQRDELTISAIQKLKSVKRGTNILIFLSYPTEYNISNSVKLLEAF